MRSIPLVDNVLDPGEHLKTGSHPLLVHGMTRQGNVCSQVSNLLLAKSLFSPDRFNDPPDTTITDPFKNKLPTLQEKNLNYLLS